MDKIDELFLNSPDENALATPAFDGDRRECKVRVTDNRVAQLLLVLHEVDVCIKGLQQFSDVQLSELVDQLTLACGFVDPAEARSAIASILAAMGPREPLDRTFS